MPQSFHVLLCVSCKTFQVHIVKKSSNKWNCKVCDTKQSVQQVYAKGSGAECREIVQRLNQARGKAEEKSKSLTLAQLSQEAGCEGEVAISHDLVRHNYDCEEDIASASVSGFSSGVAARARHTGIAIVPREQSKWRVFLEDT